MNVIEISAKEKFEAHTQALKRVYVQSFPAKKRAMSTCWQRLQQHEFDRMAAVELAHLAHKLAGSGGSYGLPRISHAASNVESELKLVLTENKISPETENRIEVLLGRLYRSMVEGSAFN
jgi:HPt (histidine-containing phosphotransfer) domain-containing protein